MNETTSALKKNELTSEFWLVRVFFHDLDNKTFIWHTQRHKYVHVSCL
uniref:Uncharacterized protein n=1 Tax=Arundo donax TaxID=35708 RepID=A0A0A9EEV5_ARUDO